MDLYRRITSSTPDEVCCLLILRRAPVAPYLPKDVHGQPIAAIAVCWTDPAEGRDAFQPLKAFGQPLADTIATKPFVEHRDHARGLRPAALAAAVTKSHYFAEISDGLIDAMLEHAGRIGSPHFRNAALHAPGGVPARLDPDMNAVGLRTAPFVLNIQAAWEHAQEDQQHMSWARSCWTATRPFSTGSAYINFR
jgi:hypothetical protein